VPKKRHRTETGYEGGGRSQRHDGYRPVWNVSKEETAKKRIPYRSERENPAELISNSLVHDVPHGVVLVEVGRALRNVDVGGNDATSTRTSEELMGDVDKVVKGSRVSAGCTTTRRTLEMVETTTWLATRTPHTTSRSGHDDVREREVVGEEDLWKAYESREATKELSAR
jgi:hypothetical protein